MLRLFAHLLFAIAVAAGLLLPTTAGGSDRALSVSTSPYLLAHANDAIQWQTWTPTTLQRAARQNKLVFLSIGYQSCHWCHRLARDTFSDARVSDLINSRFIPILVDRETRPDVDGHYMEIMQGMISRQGWPANFVLTPDGVPLFVTGYTTPDPSPGDPGLLPVLTTLATQWKSNRTAMLKDVLITRRQIRKRFQPPSTRVAVNLPKAQNTAARFWTQQFDDTYGGFGRTSKFPRPDVLLFLLDHGLRTDNVGLLNNVYKTLDYMAAGGVRDQLGGCFHRYTIDRLWQVPHFEIMLNENALLARLYIRAFQASKIDRYGSVARQILDDMLSRFRLPDGGFASSLGSDTGGKEGHYYTWTIDDVNSVLGAKDASAFINNFVDEKHGLVAGRSVLRLRRDPQLLHDTEVRFTKHLERLRVARSRRQPPQRDDKMLVSWNAVTASAFTAAAKVFDDAKYRLVAQDTVAHLVRLARSPIGLRHSYYKENASNHVFLDDYAFLIEALIDLYELEFKSAHLDQARALMHDLIVQFQGPDTSLFYVSPQVPGALLPRHVVLRENGGSSGNAAALQALYRLTQFGDDHKFTDRIQAILPSLGYHLEHAPGQSPSLLRALAFGSNDAYEIVIVGGPKDPDTKRLMKEVYTRPMRSTVLSVVPPDAPSINVRWPLLASRPLLNEKPTAYLCRKRLCDLPVDSVDTFAKRLKHIIHPDS